MTTIKNIPRYEVLGLLGEGALASVYKVRARKDGSIRALKALKPERAEDERTVARFVDEYRILSALHHPGLPEVYDYGVAPDGTRFMVIEYLEGAPLDEYIRDHPEDLWLLLFQLNEALAFIHEHHLLHLDLKPSNVLVRRTKIFGDEELPLAVLIDFGLSYRRETGGKVKLVGTPGYMAPEIIRGEENLTRAVDYYSLGVIIYEIVEGRLPFRGSIHEILRGHLGEQAVFEQQKVEYAELYPWIEKLMGKEPRVRLEAFGEFRRAVAVRLGEATSAMERVFALGYIDSLGLVGKEDAWEELKAWATKLGEGLSSRRSTAGLPGEPEAFGADGRAGVPGGADEGVSGSHARRTNREVDVSPVRDVSGDAQSRDVLKGSVTDLEKRIEEDLLSSAASARRSEDEGPLPEVARILVVSGPPESGKSHVLSVLRSELQVRGVHVVSLGEESDYETLVRPGDADVRRGRHARSVEVDPSSMVIDRFVAAWDQLAEMGRDAGVVIVVDDLDRSSVEEKEFIEYVGKRLGHELAEKNEPGVFIIAVGSARDVKKALLPAAAKEGATRAVEIPPPGKRDADAIAAGFRGRLSGAREEKSLSSYLQANLQTSASLYASLKQCIADGALVHEHGKWHFRERMTSTRRSAASTSEYYQAMCRELRGSARELVAVLACHTTALSLDQLESLSGLPMAEIDEAIETLRPLRIVEIAETQQGRRVDIISDQVRESLRLAIGKNEREQIHRRFVAYFGEMAGNTIGYFEIMGHHYEKAGLAREALLMRVRAIACARKGQDVFALRRLCDGGIDYCRGLRSREWRERKALIERYFIKQWVNAEWMVTNYGNLIKVVEENYIRRKRQVPLSFLYKYATGLGQMGAFQACKKVLQEGQQRVKNSRSEPYYLLLLEKGNVLYNASFYRESLKLLDAIPPDSLDPSSRAKLFVTYLHNYENLGLRDKYLEYLDKSERLPRGTELSDQMLRVQFSRIRALLNSSAYSSAEGKIREGIKLAAEHKAYRSLCLMYFVASGLYYEQGDFFRAMKYLDSAIRIANETGIPNSVSDYTLRYAFIYQKLGLFGNAIRSAEFVADRSSQEPSHQQYFCALVTLLDLYVTIGSQRAERILPLVETSARSVQSQYWIAMYHRALGDYLSSKAKTNLALEEYEESRRITAAIGATDERIGIEITTAMLLMSEERLEETAELIHTIRQAVGGMESADIVADHRWLELGYALSVGASEDEIQKCVRECEEIRPMVRDVNVSMRVDSELFKAAVARGDVEKAMDLFNSYYAQVRHIAGNLSHDQLVGFVQNPRFASLLQRYKELRKKGPDQRQRR